MFLSIITAYEMRIRVSCLEVWMGVEFETGIFRHFWGVLKEAEPIKQQVYSEVRHARSLFVCRSLRLTVWRELQLALISV